MVHKRYVLGPSALRRLSFANEGISRISLPLADITHRINAIVV